MPVWASAWSGRWGEVRFDGINSIFSIQMTRNRHWHIFNIQGDVRTIQNNSIEYYTITASLLHIDCVAPNIILIGHSESAPIQPDYHDKWCPNHPEQFLMVKFGIRCHLFIFTCSEWPQILFESDTLRVGTYSTRLL